MDKKEIKRSIFIAALAVAVCVTVQNFAVIAQVFMIALNALKPLIIGCIIAYIFNIIMNSFEKYYFPKSTSHKVEITRRPVCLVASFAITVAIIVLILYIVIPELAGAISVLYDEIPSQLVKLKDFVAKELQQYPEIQQKISDFNVDWSSIVEKATNLLTTGVTGILSSAVGIIGGLTMTVTNLILGFVFAAYLLLRKDKLYTDVKRIMTIAFSERSNRKIRRIYHTAHDTFRSFFVGQFVEAIILGSLCFVGMTILKLPYAERNSRRNYGSYTYCRSFHRCWNKCIHDTHGKSHAGANLPHFPHHSPAGRGQPNLPQGSRFFDRAARSVGSCRSNSRRRTFRDPRYAPRSTARSYYLQALF